MRDGLGDGGHTVGCCSDIVRPSTTRPDVVGTARSGRGDIRYCTHSPHPGRGAPRQRREQSRDARITHSRRSKRAAHSSCSIPMHMVLPAPVDAEIFLGVAFFAETVLAEHRAARARCAAGMRPRCGGGAGAEGEAQHQPQRLGHVALAGVVLAHPVAERAGSATP